MTESKAAAVSSVEVKFSGDPKAAVLMYIPVITMVKVVNVLTTRVSMNVPVMAINPFLDGSEDLEADWAMAAEPRPDSFERSPRRTPILMANLTEVPTIAPPTALIEKADLKMIEKA